MKTKGSHFFCSVGRLPGTSIDFQIHMYMYKYIICIYKYIQINIPDVKLSAIHSKIKQL